jgi:hypothetical protein
MPRILGATLLGMAALSYAHAGPITFNFTGTVGQVPIDDLGTGIQSGDAITGSITFDSTAVDAIPASTSASYTSTGPAFGISADMGTGPVMFLISGSLSSDGLPLSPPALAAFAQREFHLELTGNNPAPRGNCQ